MKYALVTLLVACHGNNTGEAYQVRTGGDVDRGHDVILAKGCAACHDIPGVRAPGGLVGPPLGGFARRTYIGGELPNTSDNLMRWLRDPHAIERRTAMPDTGLSAMEARDVAAYLYTLD
jgi:cytochrome c